MTPAPTKHIGILTFHRAESYGAVLQAYALQSTLASWLPHCRVGMVDFQPECFQFHGTKRSHYLRHQVFQTFVEKRLNMLTDNSPQLESCLRSVPDGGISDLIVGSDQVWNPVLTQGCLGDYLLHDVTNGIRKHSYAASFGVNQLQPTPAEHALFTEALHDFHTVTVREKSALKYCRDFGRDDAQEVLDPTLLASPSIYDCLGEGSPSVSLCAFFLMHEDYQRRFVRNIANILDIPHREIVFLASKPPLLTRMRHIRFPSVESFIAHLRASNYVVTDSFHGVCFSLIFQKELLVLPSRAYPERFCRIHDLLEKLGLSYRVIHTEQGTEIKDILKHPIDYKDVADRLQKFRTHSSQILKDALKAQ